MRRKRCFAAGKGLVFTQSKRLKLALSLIHGNTKLYIGALVAMLITVAVGYITPLVMRFVLDSVLGDASVDLPNWLSTWYQGLGGRDFFRDSLWVCGILLVGLNLISGAFQFGNGRLTAMASERIAENMRNRLYKHLSLLTYDYHVKAETGDLVQRCTSDVETVRRFLSGQLVQIVRALVMLAVALVILIPMSWKLTLISMALVPIIFLYSTFYFKKVVQNFQYSDEAEGAMSATLQENLTGARVVRAFGRQQFEVEKFDKKSMDFRDKTDRVLYFMAWYWGFSDFLTMLQIGVVVVAGVFFCIKGEISLGTLTVFLQYENMLLWPIRNLGRILSDLGRARVALGRLDEVLSTPIETEDEDCVEAPIDRDIVFNNVTFAYDAGPKVLDGISFSVPRGSTVAILGPTGIGKSTITYLLQRLYDYQGSITIGGVELNKIKKRHLRERIGLVLQEPFLYSKTVRENIAIVDPDMREERVFNAARSSHIHDVIQGFENGYETVIGERGVTLSGGQKQRVAIARTLARDNDVLVFDDSLSAVDTQTDAAIRTSLKKESKNITTIIISHRITTLMQADNILVMENGKIAQQGTHEELVAHQGLYKRIYDIQGALEEELSQTEEGG